MRKNASITPLRKRWRFYDAISAITSGSVGGYNIHRARVPCFDILRGPPSPYVGNLCPSRPINAVPTIKQNIEPR
jgi:hypothetical protein